MRKKENETPGNDGGIKIKILKCQYTKTTQQNTTNNCINRQIRWPILFSIFTFIHQICIMFTKFPTYVMFYFMPSTYLPSSLQYPGGTPCEYDPLFRVKDYRLPRFPVSVCDT